MALVLLHGLFLLIALPQTTDQVPDELKQTPAGQAFVLPSRVPWCRGNWLGRGIGLAVSLTCWRIVAVREPHLPFYIGKKTRGKIIGHT